VASLALPSSLVFQAYRLLTGALWARSKAYEDPDTASQRLRIACELIRNGRIGRLRQIFIGLLVDPSGDEEPTMPVPANLDYNTWLGSTPEVPHTEKRVHPQSQDLHVRYDRPGWLRCEQFGAGGQKKAPLFQTAKGKTGALTGRRMSQSEVYLMVRRRAAGAGIPTKIGNHTFRATGITAHSKTVGSSKSRYRRPRMSRPAPRACTTGAAIEISLDEVERIVI